jgi:alpha-tubulin suppressor-like RCC1 family protein
MTGALNGKTITSIVAGDDYTLAISNDGKLYSYGQNSQCILGDGNAQSYLRLSPEKVVFPTEMQERSVLSVSTSDFGHAIAITDDRKLWGWGNNFVGQVGNGNTTNVCLPVPVITDGLLFGKLFSAVAAGNGFTIALATTGELFAWGLNNAGQLGDGTYIDRLLPVAVNMTGVLAGRRVLSVSSGADHTVAVTDDGKLFSWGRNHAQQSSDGSKIDSVPVAVNMSGALKGMTPSSVYARCNLVMMITTSGRLYAWGAFFPMTTYKYYTEPTEIVIVPGKTVLSVSMSCVQISVVISDGSMYAWGIIGTVSKKSIISETPVRMDIQLLLGKTVSSVSVGYIHKTVLSNEGKIYEYLYDRMIDQENTLPTSVDMSGVLKGKTILGIALGLAHTLAIADDNMVYSWGLNNVGQLGDGTNLNRYTPVAVNASGFLAGKTVLTVAAGLFRSFALTSEGKLYSWGNNDNGYLGDGTIITQKTPVPAFTQGLLAGKIISGISTDGTIIISEGKMYRWNAFSKKPEAVPTGTLGNKTILSVSSTEHHTVILASDGSVYAYGSNYYGQLGDGTSKDKMEPVEIDMTGVMKGKRVTSIAVGAHFTVALTHDFGIYYWGSYNGFDRDTFSPTAVNINMGTAKPQQIVAGGGTAMLLLDDGRLYSWGVANFGFSTIVASPALVSTNSSTVGVFKPMIAAGTTSSIYFVPRGCETGYTGYECSYPMCWGKNSTDSMVCNGQGTCSAYNTCDCNKYFTGSECKEWTLTSGMIFLGISLSVIIITGLLIGLPILFMYTRYRRRFTKQQQVETEMKDLLEQSLIRADALSEKIDRDWIISFDDLKFLEKLSEGSFGVVFKGRYKCADV